MPVLGLFLTVLTVGRGAEAGTPNAVAQWNKMAEDVVVGSGAFQIEGLMYMGYTTAAVYDAVAAIEGGYEPYGKGVKATDGASTDAAIAEAAYQTLVHYFHDFLANPANAVLKAKLDKLYGDTLAAIPDGQAKTDGQAVGQAAATLIIDMRQHDGRMTPIATTSSFPKKTPAPGVWRLTPPAFAPPQTPWMAFVTPFVLESSDQFLPDEPPSLDSDDWVEAFNEIEAYGSVNSTVRSQDQTATALFWTANSVRQYNLAVRDVIDGKALNLLESARLQAMVNMIGADAGVSVMNAKYHYLFWRPVTAIDPTSVKPLPGDTFGPIPGFDDGNPKTGEETGWRPLVATPNHPEYPSAHGTVSSAIAEAFRAFLGSNQFNLTIHGYDGVGPANLNAVRVFATPQQLRNQIVDARLFAGLHYRFSTVTGESVGRKVARYDLRHAFRPLDDQNSNGRRDK